MLQEVLLALSGHPSPLFDEDRVRDFPHVSPAEIALLQSVGRLASLHKAVRSHIALIVENHTSVICRTVATRIESHHLSCFQAAIVDLEKQILASDSTRVGAYHIVPLASVIGNLNEWRRRLKWCWDLACFMMPTDHSFDRAGPSGHFGCGPAVIDRLRTDCNAGYPDIEKAALDLSKTAESTWLRQLSSWLLRGAGAMSSENDFFLQTDRGRPFIKARFLPNFLTEATASSILYISKMLNYIHATRDTSEPATPNPEHSPHNLREAALTTRMQYVRDLAGIKIPIVSSDLARTIATIRTLLSKNLMLGVLPVDSLLGTLALLRDFHLMHKNEFAESLIIEAHKHLRSRSAQMNDVAHSGSEALAGIIMKDSEVSKVLQNTWAAMASTISMERTIDPQLEWARDNVNLRLVNSSNSSGKDLPQMGVASVTARPDLPRNLFCSFLLSTPVELTIAVKPPMDLFLSSEDVEAYSIIGSYLIAIRRSHVHLANLWRQSQLRKGAALSNKARSSYKYRIFFSKKLRLRASARERALRPVWAVMGSAVFFLTELGEYLNSEVITQSWKALFDWFHGKDSKSRGKCSTLLPQSTTARVLLQGAHPQAAASANFPPSQPHLQQQQSDNLAMFKPQNDPEMLSKAHRQYLAMLLQTLLLKNESYIGSLHVMLSRVDQLTALVLRLQSVQDSLDLHDEGVDDGFSERYAAEEREVFASLVIAAQKLQSSMTAVTEQLRSMDAIPQPPTSMQQARAKTGFDPWQVPSVDRLLLRLDLKLSKQQLPVS